MRIPNIGVTCATEQVAYAGAWLEDVAMVPQAYVRAVVRAQGRPLLLAPVPADAEDPDTLLDLLDGVILTGGAGDVDPVHYEADRHPETAPVEPLRDRFELAIVRAAARRDLPCLGVCRGLHVINVAYGGALEQHLPDALGHDGHRGDPGAFAHHVVRVEPGTVMARAAGGDRLAVKSYHHQGVGRLADGLRASGWALDDGSVEAIEDERLRFMLGVQWHPEEDEADKLIAGFVEECRAARALR